MGILALRTTLRNFLIVTAAYVLLQILVTSNVFAATVTWDGGGDGSTFTDALNWAGDVAPVAGDDLVFDVATSPDNPVNSGTLLNNDFPAATQFNSISMVGEGSMTADGYAIEGNSMEILSALNYASILTDLIINNDITVVSGDISSDYYYSAVTSIIGDVSGTGGFTISSDTDTIGGLLLSGNNTFTGDITVNSGSLNTLWQDTSMTPLGDVAGKTIINDGASLTFTVGTSDWVVDEDIDFSGAANADSPGGAKLRLGVGYGPLSSLPDNTVTFSGNITANADTTVWSYGQNVIIDTLTLNNDSAFTRAAGSFGTLTANSQTFEAPYDESIIADDNASTPITIGNHDRTIVNGVRGDVTVNFDGILGGIGTVGNVTVDDGGIVAPGLSPGCLTTGNYDQNGGDFTVEIDGAVACTEYDQLTVNGTVDIDTATTLNVVWDSAFTPSVGNTFTIVSNDATDAVTGTFASLAEGATLTIDGIVLSISYAGGDGNDVVLTVDSVPVVTPAPEAPDTGFTLGLASWTAVLATTSIAAGTLVLAARKQN